MVDQRKRHKAHKAHKTHKARKTHKAHKARKTRKQVGGSVPKYAVLANPMKWDDNKVQ